MCRLDHRIGGCARTDGGGSTRSSWLLPLQEKKLKLRESGVMDGMASLKYCVANTSTLGHTMSIHVGNFCQI